MDPELQERVLAAVDMVGRSGGTEFELGYLEDDVPMEQARWWAKARFGGHMLSVEEHRSPWDAAEALMQRVMKNAKCRWCGKTISWGKTNNSKKCGWQRVNGRWEPGCKLGELQGVREIGVEHVADDPDDVDLPAKEPGRHRWVAVAAYVLTDQEAEDAMTGTDVLLDSQKRLTVGVSCYDCEMPYPLVKDKPCPAEGDD